MAVHEFMLPESYVRPDTQRPHVDEAVTDLANLDHASVVSHGFFQAPTTPHSISFYFHSVLQQDNLVKIPQDFDREGMELSWLRVLFCSLSSVIHQVLNHGIPVELMLPEMAVAQEFFGPPPEKAKLCSDEPAVHNWRDCKLSEGTPLKSSGYGENWHESKMFALVAPHSLSPGDGSSSSTVVDSPVPLLWLDSGAAIHVVGDAKILTNLRDPPTEMAVTVADGSQLPITKVGVIQAPNINISDVYLAPGLEMNLVSVRQLAKSKIVTTFNENYAELWLEGDRIGGAIVDNHVSLYRLCFFKPPA